MWKVVIQLQSSAFDVELTYKEKTKKKAIALAEHYYQVWGEVVKEAYVTKEEK